MINVVFLDGPASRYVQKRNTGIVLILRWFLDDTSTMISRELPDRARVLICPGRISIVSDSPLKLSCPVSGDFHNHTLIVLNRAYHIEPSSLLVVSSVTCIAS